MIKAALISPYWDILGGGEKYLLDIGYFLHQNGYEVEIFWPDKQIKTRLLQRFGQKYDFFSVNSRWQQLSSWQKTLNSCHYEAIFYHSDGSYFWSLAKNNYQLFQVPDINLIPHHNWWQTFKFSQWTPIFNSEFTKRIFLKHAQVKKHHLLYPTIDSESNNYHRKDKIILSVGRFFGHLHSKKQEILIKAFISGLQKYPELAQYQLILAGSFKSADQNYLNYLKKISQNYSQIKILTNLTHRQIQALYQKASIYWHAAGYQVNERQSPELVEHFGIAIVEAMNHYCVPVVYQAGGPKETVSENQSGFFFTQPKTLLAQTLKLIKKPELCQQMALNAHKQAVEKFGTKAFNNSLQKIIQ